MWICLVTDIFFFAGLSEAYTIYRWENAWAFADASRHMDVALGTINTAVLIFSSLTMAMAVHSAATGRRRLLMGFLIATMILGGAFLGIKAVEYTDHIQHHLFPGPGFHYPPGGDARGASLFFSLYFAMTGLHALHMIIGLGILTVLLLMARRGRVTPVNSTPAVLPSSFSRLLDTVRITLCRHIDMI